MNNYETIMILDATREEEEQRKTIEKITDLIGQNGQVESTEIWGTRKLAYPIQKRTEGYYVLINFASTPEFIDELNRIYNITDEILKHIIVRKD